MFYWIKSSLDFVVVYCAVYPQFNELTGQIHTFKKQSGQYIVAVNTSEYTSSRCPPSVLAQLCPQYMEPLHKVTKFGINISSYQRNKEVVSVPNQFCGSEQTAQQIMIKFHWQVLEQMRKRFDRMVITSNNLSSNTLWVELSKIDNQALVKKQQDATDKLEYAGLYSNVRSKCKYNFFKMPFQISRKSLFMSGSQFSHFDLNRNTTSLLTR